ncbi:MAG: OmpH family outer membrane protein [Bacteroidota bacterium]
MYAMTIRINKRDKPHNVHSAWYLACFGLLHLLLFLHPLGMDGQQISVIDNKEILHQTEEYIELNKIYSHASDSLTMMAKDWLEKFTKHVNEKTRRLGCASPMTLQKVMEEFTKEEALLSSFETFLTDTLPLFQAELTDLINNRIKGLVSEYCANNNIKVVLDKEMLFYHQPTLDISAIITERYKAKYAAPIHREEWKSLLNQTYQRYKIRERLNQASIKVNKM